MCVYYTNIFKKNHIFLKYIKLHHSAKTFSIYSLLSLLLSTSSYKINSSWFYFSLEFFSPVFHHVNHHKHTNRLTWLHHPYLIWRSSVKSNIIYWFCFDLIQSNSIQPDNYIPLVFVFKGVYHCLKLASGLKYTTSHTNSTDFITYFSILLEDFRV